MRSYLLLIPWLCSLAQAISLTDVKAKASGWSRPEAFLQYVKDLEPDRFESFTLIKNSRSRQKSSPTYPRALVFGKDASFVFAFNGSSVHKGFNTIEMFQYDSAGEKFAFHQLDFASGKGVLSEANPKDCLKCHTANPHPLWDEYDFWPTAFGAYDDSIINFSGFEGREYFALQTKQYFEFGEFLSVVSGHSRYEFLKFPPGSPVSPYSIREKGEYHELRPNGRLTAFLVRQHAAQVSRLILDHPKSAKIAPKLMRIFLECEEKKKGEPWAAPALLAELGIGLDEWSLVFQPTKWGYSEGTRNLSDFVATSLYKKLQKTYPALPSFRPVGEVGYDEKIYFDVGDAYYEKGAEAIKVKPACDALKP